MTVTFDVSNVDLADDLLPETSSIAGLARLLSPIEKTRRGESEPQSAEALGIEDCSDANGTVVSDVSYNPLFSAAHKAFNDHRPLILSPDMIWLAIAQGTANHINNNSEELRDKLVSHQGQADIVVRRDDFVKGSKHNPWPEAFNAFSMAIKDHVGEETHTKFVAGFSTTGLVEAAANQVVLMDSVKSYFRYILLTRCGIPTVTLEGTIVDWMHLYEKVQALSDIIPGWWMEKLDPICQQFIWAMQGRADPAHWENMYKYGTRSGSDFNDGWLTHLLPYVRPPQSGEAILQNQFSSRGIKTSAIPGGLCTTPFIWDYLGTKFDMSFMAGFSAVTQDHQTLALRPKIGWVVRDNKRIIP